MSLLLLTLLLPLSGCWDRTEINDVGFVLSTGLDIEKDGQIRYSVLLPLPGQMGGPGGGGGGTSGDKSYYIDSEVGETYRDAQMKLQKRMSRRMYLAHRRTILIGEEMAKRGIRDLFDATPRNPENRMSTYMLVTKGKAFDALAATPRFERFPSEAIRELAKYRTFEDMNMKDIGLGLSSQGGDPVAVYIAIKESEKSEKPSKEIELKGYAQFRGDKMIGTLENETAQGFSWLNNSDTMGNVTLIIAEDHLMTLNVHNTKTKITVNINNGKIEYLIHTKAKATLAEDRSFYDLSQTKKIIEVEHALSAYIKKSIQALIDKSLKTNTDPALLGTYVWRAYPEIWKQSFKKEWPEAMKEARFTIQVESDLTNTGLIYENVTKERTDE
ncbi:Ger(x)C family spore germination protein [Paenibacillus sp. LMG 31456]|uniref:Ger(X)C family spore germination protein n=2 Tax=Paenibacillus foliorum TaxID=2654974 RepID=A0A972GPN3_9BACL|nr:Ger(x)C family spore germination protein [Paenibacillus foliorum]